MSFKTFINGGIFCLITIATTGCSSSYNVTMSSDENGLFWLISRKGLVSYFRDPPCLKGLLITSEARKNSIWSISANHGCIPTRRVDFGKIPNGFHSLDSEMAKSLPTHFEAVFSMADGVAISSM